MVEGVDSEELNTSLLVNSIVSVGVSVRLEVIAEVILESRTVSSDFPTANMGSVMTEVSGMGTSGWIVLISITERSSGSSVGLDTDSVLSDVSWGTVNVSPRWGTNSALVTFSLTKSSTFKSVSSCSSLMMGATVVINSSSWPAGVGRGGAILVENIEGGCVGADESSDSSVSDRVLDVGVSVVMLLSSRGMEVELMVVRISTTDISTKEVWLITFLLPKRTHKSTLQIKKESIRKIICLTSNL